MLVNGLESMASAMYEQFVETLTEPELRAEVMVLGAQDGRRAAAVAIVATGAPEGYVNPELLGEELVIEEGALTPIWAIPTASGSLAPILITVGAPNEAGTRFSTNLETPADNSFIYDGLTCSA